MPVDRPFSGEGSIANLFKRAEVTKKRFEETLKEQNLKREQEEAEARYKQETESLLNGYIEEYQKTKLATNKSPSAKIDTSLINEYCSTKLRKERIQQIAPELRDAQKEFTNASTLQEFQKWKEENPEIVEKRKQYISTVTAIEEKDKEIVYDFVSKHYGKISVTPLNPNRDRSFTG